MIDAEAIKALQESGREPKVVEVDGLRRVYVPHADGGWDIDTLEYLPRAVEPLRVATLDALAAVANTQKWDAGSCVHVPSHAEARICGALVEGRRDLYAVAAAEPAYGDGNWRPGPFFVIEEAVIALQTRFAPTTERDGLMSLLSRIRDENVREDADDGVTQRVTVRSGAALAQDVAVKNPWLLRPYRTFREAEQPVSAFIVRLRSGKGEGPTVALFEADGGRWKLEAVKAAADYLRGLGLPDGLDVVA